MTSRIAGAIALAAAAVRLDAATLTAAQRQAIDKVLGATGTYYAAEDTHRLAFPRNEAKVTVDGTALHPFMGLTSWAAFTAGPNNAVVVMGDLALIEDEVNPVMSAALEGGLEVTALHNHFFFDNPKVMFMHIGGSGPAETIAAGVRKALDAMREVRRLTPEPARQFAGPPVAPLSTIDAEGINGILRTTGQVNGGMYKVSFGRTVAMHGVKAGNQMGVNTWAAFFGSMDRAFVDGDFACTRLELQIVLKSLRRRGIYIVAIHNHMSGEDPPLTFLHYWGKGRAAELAVALRAVLDEQAKAPKTEAGH
jgi:hypothetical protein